MIIYAIYKTVSEDPKAFQTLFKNYTDLKNAGL